VSLAEPWARTKRRLRGARRFVSSGSPEYLGAEADGHPPRPAGVSEVSRKLHRLVRACKSIPDSRSCRFQKFSGRSPVGAPGRVAGGHFRRAQASQFAHGCAPTGERLRGYFLVERNSFRFSRLLADLHHLTTAKIWVAGGGAGGDAPDALASALGLPYGQPQPPKHPCPSMRYDKALWSSPRTLSQALGLLWGTLPSAPGCVSMATCRQYFGWGRCGFSSTRAMARSRHTSTSNATTPRRSSGSIPCDWSVAAVSAGRKSTGSAG